MPVEPAFCLETAMLLAGFAFETYNQPDINWELRTDGSRTGILSPAFVREHFDGVLAIDAVKAELFRPTSLLPLQSLDTYLVLQLSDAEPVRTETVRGSQSPEWSSGRFLYVRNPESSTLLLSIYCEKPLGGGDELLGRTQVPVKELFDTSLRLWGERRGLSGGGRIELKATYVPLTEKLEVDVDKLQSIASELTSSSDLARSVGTLWSRWRADRAIEANTGVRGERRGSRLTSTKRDIFNSKTWFEAEAPKGARGAAGVDWGELCKTMGGAAATGSLSFEACCFIENEATNTQCGIWRQGETKTLVVSFRGTQTDQLRDVLTDLSFMQRRATPAGETLTAAGRRATLRQADAGNTLAETLQSSLSSLRAGDYRAALKEMRDVELAVQELRISSDERDRLTRNSSTPEVIVDGVPPMVHSGFYDALQSVLPATIRLIKMCTGSVDGLQPAADNTLLDGSRAGDGWTIYVTGHSLGGALATLMCWEIEAIRAAELPSVSSVQLYNFGSPRVGNAAFARSFNKAIPTAFRIINGLDVVARVPRPSNLSFAGEWEQVGRTVLLKPETSEATANLKGIWIEGEDDGECPVRELAPAPLAQGVKRLDALWAGLADGTFLQRELSLLRTVGDGIAHHLEDSYHDGMAKAIEGWDEVLRKRQQKGVRVEGAAERFGGISTTGDAVAALAASHNGEKANGEDDGEDGDGDSSAGGAVALHSSDEAPRRENGKDGGIDVTVDEATVTQLDRIIKSELESILRDAKSSSEETERLREFIPRLQRRATDELPAAASKGELVPSIDSLTSSSRLVADRLREVVKGELASGAWNLRDLSLMLRIVLLLAASLSPAAALLPARILISTYSTVLASELGERFLEELVAQLQQRLQQGVSDTVRGFTGKSEYQFGDLTRAAVAKATGKPNDEYEFGDITRAAVSRVAEMLAGEDTNTQKKKPENKS